MLSQALVVVSNMCSCQDVDIKCPNDTDLPRYEFWPPKVSAVIWGPLSRMLHDILDDDHLQWHPPLIRHFTNFLTFSLIARGFHRTFATGAACQQRTLTPLDTWSCPTLGLASVLMLRPISPELVLSPDFWVSNIRRYFCFCCTKKFLCCDWMKYINDLMSEMAYIMTFHACVKIDVNYFHVRK